MAKSNAQRQSELRQRIRSSGAVVFTCFFDKPKHAMYKRAATFEEMTLEDWIKKTLEEKVSELKKKRKVVS